MLTAWCAHNCDKIKKKRDCKMQLNAGNTCWDVFEALSKCYDNQMSVGVQRLVSSTYIYIHIYIHIYIYIYIYIHTHIVQR